MAEKVLNTRIIHKHDTEENWRKAQNFIPKQGELIVYDIDATHDYERIKMGDGKTLVNNLPFISSGNGILVDDTLSISSAAADAKVTGEALAGKLDNTPGTWPAWTADEQAAARERMGIPGDYVLIEEITLEEDVSYISRSKEPDGTPYSFSAFCIIAEINISDSDESLYMRVDASSKTNSNLFLEYFTRSALKGKRIHVNYEALSPKLFRLSSEINDKGTVLFSLGSVSVRNLAYFDNPILSTVVNNIYIGNIILCAGTTIKIYGVRA